MCRQGAGVEIYPGSVCRLVGNGIHHCKDGVLIKVTSTVNASQKQMICFSIFIIIVLLSSVALA